MRKLLFELRMRKVSALRSLIICVLFVIIGVSSITLMASFAAVNLDGATNNSITNDTVFINDLESDYNYYMGLNYTTITNNNIPTYTNRYNDNNLVRVFVTYSGVDINNNTLIGRVSKNESQYEFRYYKYYPKDNNGYIDIELPDNPYAARPNNKGFNGWVTSDTNATLRIDKDTYTRYARVYVGNNANYSITFNASWTNAVVIGNANRVGELNNYGMVNVPTADVMASVWDHNEVHYYTDPNKTYYDQMVVTQYQSYSGYTCDANTSVCTPVNAVCQDINGCRYYGVFTGEYSDHYLSFIEYQQWSGNMALRTAYDNEYLRADYNVPAYVIRSIGQKIDLPNGASLVGYYHREQYPGGGSASLFYDANGLRCDQGGACNNGQNAYRLIQANDNANIRVARTEVQNLPEHIGQGENVNNYLSNLSNPSDYYYLATRDTNIWQLGSSQTNITALVINKPVTVTSQAFGGNTVRTINNKNDAVVAFTSDIVIENVRIDSDLDAAVNDNIGFSRVISANRHNIKIGRTVTRSQNTEFTAYGVTGTNASSNNNSRFKVIIEAGVYDYLLSNGSGGTTDNLTQLENRMQGTFVYGSDYDRVAGNNTNLIVTYCAYASNNGGLRAPNDTTPSSQMIIKSGSFGKGTDGANYDTDYSHGVYVGSRGGNTNDFSLRSLIIEGGDINVVNGGPLVDPSYYNRNVVSLYMKGGNVRTIFGGAGRSGTGGNRIVSVTGGTIVNNVFGGSNSYQGDTGEGYLDGNTLVYVGGNIEIGTGSSALYSSDNGLSPGVGDVFGAGNGRSGSQYANIGDVNNSTVIINGGTIHGSVYGGGNFGGVGKKVVNSTTNIQLLGGTIDGSVYGAGNNSGAGSLFAGTSTQTYYTNVGTFYSGQTATGYRPNGTQGTNMNCDNNYPGRTMVGNYYSGYYYVCKYATGRVNNGQNITTTDSFFTVSNNQFVAVPVPNVNINPSAISDTATPPTRINITLNGSNVGEAIYGGSNTSGSVNGAVDISMISNAGSSVSVYGGGKGEDTYIKGDIRVHSNQSDNSRLVVNEVYGGSALGHVNVPSDSFDTKVTIDGGTFQKVFGGSEGNSSVEPESAGDIEVIIKNGTITEVFGGNDQNGVPAKSVTVNLEGGSITDAYGGGNNSAINLTTVNLIGATVTDSIYGGSKSSGANNGATVNLTSGSAVNVFGGNNIGGSVGETVVYYNGENVNVGTVYGCGEGVNSSCGVTNVYINRENAHMGSVYGGGYAASVTGKAQILMLKGEIDYIFGGSNTNGTVAETDLYLSGGTIHNVFGGNDAGGRTVQSIVNVGGGNLDNVYGGGRNAETTNTYVRHYGGYSKNLYGGGYSAGVTEATHVNVYGGIVTDTFGGSNSSGIVTQSNVNVAALADSEHYDPEQQYNGEAQHEVINYDVTITFRLNETQATHDNNNGCWYQLPEACARRSATRMTVIVQNDMDEPLETYKLYIDGDNVYIAPTGSNYNWLWHKIKYDNDKGKYYIDEEYADYVVNGNWTGDHSTTQTIPAHSTVTFGGDFWIFSDDEDPNSMVQNLITYTDAGHVDVSYEYPEYQAQTMIVYNVYGGNNAGGNTIDTNVSAVNGYASYVYGGSKGTGATATNTNVNLKGGEIINVYGGGDEAVTTGNTNVEIVSGVVENLFGGGNGEPATVEGNTYVIVDGGVTSTNMYGGGNHAVTEGNTTVSVIAGTINGSLFGSGDAAETGTEASPSVSTVNILAGTINGNVYGGANFSKVNGRTDVNIGENTVSDPILSNYISTNNITYNKEITINGTVYGGGEAKSANDTEYNFDYISVTQGIEIDIDAENYTMVFDGSVFGSGNASSSAGVSTITIRNLGTTSNIVDIESIQRATNVRIINSNIQILGAKDSTNKYSNYFTLNRIDHFYLLNNSSIYLKDGANVLKEFNSGLINNNDEFTKEAITINDSGAITSQNVNNRLFMWPNKTLNVLTDEELNPNYAGIVNGMCFLGLYLPDGDHPGQMKHGIYDTSIPNNTTVSSTVADLMRYSGTSVYGKHKTDHNIEVDGYWSHYLNEENNKVTVDYVDTTPKNSNYYIWAVGIQLKTYEIDLYASRYSTLGVKNLALTGLESPNTVLMVEAFQYDNLAPGVTIIDKNQVKKVADNSTIANSRFGLAMSTSDTGWMSKESTDFFSTRPSFSGSTTYTTESSESTPTLSFYLYNSKNIELNEGELQREMGYSSVIITAITHDPDDPLTNYVVNIEVKVNIYLQDTLQDGYGSVIAPGKKYSVFPYVATNISSNGSVSIYHNLYLDLNGKDIHGVPWSRQRLYPNTGAYRALVSDFVYPVGTTITMIDLTDNQYYYYTVTSSNIAAKQQELASSNQVSYYLRDFIKMDSTSTNNHYDDATSNNRYYNASNNSAFEEFIFTVDFSNANVTQPVTSKLYLELRKSTDNSTIITPLASQGDRMKFSLYTDANTQLITTGTLSSDTLYVGESVTLNLDTEYHQAVDPLTQQTLYDTAYDDYQLGSTITFFDSNGLQLDDQSLLGVVININGTNYYAQTDGTYRVNLAGKVATVSSVVTIDTASSNMPSGEYTMRIDTFGSYDGLYSGELKNEPLILPITVLNNKYGLLVESSDVSITHDKNDGTDEDGEREIDFVITTSSGQNNPNLRVRLERRTYNDETTYGDLTYEYETVNFEDIFEDELTVADANRKLYYVTQDLPENINFSLTVKEGPLTTGTYRIVFGIYDGNNYIGSVYRYLIIREMK